MKKLAVCALVIAIAAPNWSCSNMSNTKKGAVIGAGAGGTIGGIIGHQSGNTAVGAIIGAAVGGAAGAYISNPWISGQRNPARPEGAKVERIGEGIKITFDSGLLFDVDKAVLKPASKTNLTNLAVILNKYPDTEILLEGHTDSDGSDEHNLHLSEMRANSVANYLAGQQVMESRFTTMGYGESQPVAETRPKKERHGIAASKRIATTS
jgi:outer membrane protein OmpA-like peptidoglycan-associated protein